jgi:hypothetical protein
VADLAGPNGQVALALVVRWTGTAEVGEFGSAFAAVAPKLAGPSRYAALGDHAVSIVVAPTAAMAQTLSAALHP